MSQVNFTNLKADLENVETAFSILMLEGFISEAEFNKYTDHLHLMKYEAEKIIQEAV